MRNGRLTVTMEVRIAESHTYTLNTYSTFSKKNAPFNFRFNEGGSHIHTQLVCDELEQINSSNPTTTEIIKSQQPRSSTPDHTIKRKHTRPIDAKADQRASQFAARIFRCSGGGGFFVN
jgi:hypothetical protein